MLFGKSWLRILNTVVYFAANHLLHKMTYLDNFFNVESCIRICPNEFALHIHTHESCNDVVGVLLYTVYTD